MPVPHIGESKYRNEHGRQGACQVRKWLAAVLAGAVLTAGCMGGGQQQVQQSPEPSGEQVEKAVVKVLHEEDMKDFLRTSVRTQAGAELLELALDTQDGQKVLQDAVKRALSSSVGQQAISNKVGEMMSDPMFQTQVQLAIRESILEMLTKGTAAKAGGGGGEKKNGKEKKGGEEGGGGGGGGGGGSGGGGGN